MSNEGYVDQVFELARLHKRYTDGLEPNLIYGIYGFAQNREDQLRERVIFPEDLSQVQIMLYDQMSLLYGWVGGGIQFNIGDKAVRTQVYRIEDEDILPMPPFDIEQVGEIAIAARKLEKACCIARLSIDPDLTTITGGAYPATILQVPQPIDL